MTQTRLSRRRFLAVTGAATALGLTHGRARAQKRTLNPIALEPSHRHPETVATLRVRRPDQIRLLQVTDLHFHNGRDRLGPGPDQRTTDDLKRTVDVWEPDLIAVTGDLWHDNPAGQGERFMAYSIAQLEPLGVPWLFTWGNHDQLTDYVAGHDAFRMARNCVYRGGPQGGNYKVNLVDTGGRGLWELLCLNTTNLGLQLPQRDWIDGEHARRLQTNESSPPGFCFLHIPLLQYHYLWEEEIASGLKREAVCSDGENGRGLWHLERLGNIRALFCGHDHVNDYSGVIEGIELAYGRATGHAGYGGDEVRKGAKLITANGLAGTYTWETVFPDGRHWRPSSGFRTDKVVEAYWMRHDESVFNQRRGAGWRTGVTA
jgi:3',5'-cyclic AMP phosphodiesterase CpdA